MTRFPYLERFRGTLVLHMNEADEQGLILPRKFAEPVVYQRRAWNLFKVDKDLTATKGGRIVPTPFGAYVFLVTGRTKGTKYWKVAYSEVKHLFESTIDYRLPVDPATKQEYAQAMLGEIPEPPVRRLVADALTREAIASIAIDRGPGAQVTMCAEDVAPAPPVQAPPPPPLPQQIEIPKPVTAMESPLKVLSQHGSGNQTIRFLKDAAMNPDRTFDFWCNKRQARKVEELCKRMKISNVVIRKAPWKKA